MWADGGCSGMSVFFTADLHFNHSGIIGYCGRRNPWTGETYRTAGEMNRALIQQWNSRVLRESDIVWCLGDFGFPVGKGPDAGEELDIIFHKLRGIKNFVRGNHDLKNKSQVLALPWENAVVIRDGAGKPERTILPDLVTFKDNGRRAVLCHYPLETWDAAARGALMLHGHSHGSLKRVIPHRFDVGVDTELGKDGPIDFETIWEISTKQAYKVQDHHAEKRPEVEL
jgi:calcineurin-like phosphoesterase family protein